MPDTSGQAATSLDSTAFTLTIEEAAELYANAGHPRTTRTIQRYCASGHLDCTKAATTLGDKYFVSPQSVARHISQIAELAALDMRATIADMSRPAATTVAQEPERDTPRPSTTMSEPSQTGVPIFSDDLPRHAGDTGRDLPRQDATQGNTTEHIAPSGGESQIVDKYVVAIERENEFLRAQVKTKDSQIADLSTRFSETQRLVAGLQRMMAPLLGQGDPYRTTEHNQPPTPEQS